MYIPNAFREHNTAKMHEFMCQHSFAVVTSHGTHGLFATHLPLLLDADRGSFGTLVGHFAKANEQIHDATSECLVVFNGPHAYVSPTWYATPNLVPTWNYVAVHAYGVLKLIEDSVRLSKILEQTVGKYERSRAQPWPFDSQSEFHQKLLDGIVGFEIEVTRLEGKWKLNQNHPNERRQRVIAVLEKLGGENNLAIAALMKEINS